MNRFTIKPLNIFNIILAVVALIGLYIISYYNYLLFHTLSELFSIVIAVTVSLIAWNSRKYIENDYLIFVGIAYFFIAVMDLIHTLAYKGMSIFTSYDYYANQLWIAARYIESITLLIAFVFLSKKVKVHPYRIVYIYIAISAFVYLTIFYWKIFPECYNENTGLTLFKKTSEYIISLILIISILLLVKNRRYFDEKVYRLLIAAIACTIISELAFTFYISNYGFSNMIGHYFKIFSYFAIYKSIIETGLTKPFHLLFRELKQNEADLKQLNATKDKFFSIIAHDLKNPFSTIIGFTDLLLMNPQTNTSEKYERFVRMIHTASSQGFNLLENLLEWSRSQTNRIQYAPKTLKPDYVIKESIALIESKAKQKDITIEYQNAGEMEIYADSYMLSTILRNLLSNAVKFTPPKGMVTVDVLHKSNATWIRVKDNGVGISPENQKKLFRLDKNYSTTGTSQERGTGLGLILCKEFTEKHGGKIWVESEIGKFSIFTFTIPHKQ